MNIVTNRVRLCCSTGITPVSWRAETRTTATDCHFQFE